LESYVELFSFIIYVRKTEGQSRMEKPETLATFDTQDTRLRQTKRITQNRKLKR
jgi:hypothetical protein